MQTELTDSAGSTYKATVIKVDPTTQIADLEVELDVGGLHPLRLVARGFTRSKDRRPMTWRQAS